MCDSRQLAINGSIFRWYIGPLTYSTYVKCKIIKIKSPVMLTQSLRLKCVSLVLDCLALALVLALLYVFVLMLALGNVFRLRILQVHNLMQLSDKYLSHCCLSNAIRVCEMCFLTKRNWDNGLNMFDKIV